VPTWARRTLIGGGALLGVCAVILGAVAGYGLYLNHRVHRVAVHGLTGSLTSGQESGTENILLVGSTSRCALKVQNPAYGLCSQGVTGVNSDVTMLLHLNRATRTVSLLSIPRDTFVPNARKEGANKIDAALAEGPAQLVAAIQQDYGIPIQHYVELNFDTFAGVVDALGGVKLNFPEPVFDAESGLNVPTAGCLDLNGTRALQVVRARHLQYKPPTVTSSNHATWPQETESDLARIRRTHEFLRVLAGAVAQRGLSNPLTDQRIAAAVAPQLQVDAGLNLSALVDLLLTFHSVDINAAPQLTAPVVPTTFGSYIYRGGDYGDIVWPSQPQDQQVVDQFLGISPGTDPLTGRPLPQPADITVSVTNGSGQARQGSRVADALTELGVTVTGTSTAAPVAKQSETVVYYASPAQEPAAQRVLQTLSGWATLGMDPSKVTPGADVTVVTGTDVTVPTATSGSTPAPTTTRSPAATPTAAASPGTPAVQSQAQAPTPSVEPLQPWDPRGCLATTGTPAP
jgi:LCP family protein required for cell wall assembly